MSTHLLFPPDTSIADIQQGIGGVGSSFNLPQAPSTATPTPPSGPAIPEGAKDLGDGAYAINFDLPGPFTGVAVTDQFGETNYTVFDSSSGGGARGPTAEELQIMRDELKIRQDQLQVNRDILTESTRSNIVQEDLALQGLGINQGTLDELIRSSLIQEEGAQKDRALTAASNALTGYLRAAELSDARRLASLQLQRDFLPFQVDPNKEFFGGGPEGSLATASQNFGLNFQPTAIQHQTVDPAGLAQIDPVAGANLTEAIDVVTQAGGA